MIIMAKLAAVLIRGRMGARVTTKDALDTLLLKKKHVCVVLEDTKENRGMLNKVKDFVTYGPVSDETLEEIKKQRKPNREGVLTTFNLAPPRGGFERKGIKKTVNQGGAIGARKEIDSLLKRML